MKTENSHLLDKVSTWLILPQNQILRKILGKNLKILLLKCLLFFLKLAENNIYENTVNSLVSAWKLYKSEK